MDCSTPGSSVLHYLLEFPQIHAHWVSDAVISDSAAPFSSCPQSFWESGSLLMNQFFASDDQVLELQLRYQILPMNIQGWFPLWLTGLISLQSKELSGVSSSTRARRHHFFSALPFCFFTIQLSQLYVTTGKTIALTIWTFVSRVTTGKTIALTIWTFVSRVISLL